MSKRGRKANRLRRSQRDEALALARLSEAAIIVGDLFDDGSKCIEAAALFVSTAQQLGYLAEPRAVSTLVWHPTSRTIVATSQDAVDAARELGIPFDEDAAARPDFGWAGHMVVTVAEPTTVWDPNFRQFSRGGVPKVSLGAKTLDNVPTRGYWELREPGLDLYVRHMPGPPPANFETIWARLLIAASSMGIELASALRDGATVETIRLSMHSPED